MPPRSTVYTLDEVTRADLDRRIVAAGFGGYADHAAWLSGQGHAVSAHVLQRYGKRLRRTVDADSARATEATAAAVARIRQTTELAHACANAGGGDPVAIAEKSAEAVMLRLFELTGREDVDAKTLQTITRAVNETLRSIAAIREEQSLRAASNRAGKEMKKRGLTPETAKAIRDAIETPQDVLTQIRRDVYGIEPEVFARDSNAP